MCISSEKTSSDTWHLYADLLQVAIFVFVAVKGSFPRKSIPKSKVPYNAEGFVGLATAENRKWTGLWPTCTLMRALFNIFLSFPKSFMSLKRRQCGLRICLMWAPAGDPLVLYLSAEADHLLPTTNRSCFGLKMTTAAGLIEASVLVGTRTWTSWAQVYIIIALFLMFPSRMADNVNNALSSKTGQLIVERDRLKSPLKP